MEAIAETVDARLARSVAEDRFSGAVLIKVRGQPILSNGYGDADRDRRIPNSPETLFRVGSINKMFTATAALQLVQQSRLNLHAVVGDVIAEYPEPAVAAKVTIHHLLTHTSGLGDFWGPEFAAHRRELLDRKVLVIDPARRHIEAAIDVAETGHWIALAPDASMSRPTVPSPSSV